MYVCTRTQIQEGLLIYYVILDFNFLAIIAKILDILDVPLLKILINL